MLQCAGGVEQMSASSIDPDQTAPEEQSDLGLYCLPCTHFLPPLWVAEVRQRYFFSICTGGSLELLSGFHPYT